MQSCAETGEHRTTSALRLHYRLRLGRWASPSAATATCTTAPTVFFHVLRGFGGKAGRELIYKPYENNTIQHNLQQYLPALHEKYEFKKKHEKNLHNNKNVIIFVVSLKTSSLNDKEGLKARIEELKSDLDFYLCYRTRLSKRSRRMKAVIEKEIKQLEDEISRLYELLRD